MTTPRCKTCNAPLRWERTEHGRSIPLDPEPTDEGTVVVTRGIAKVFGSPDEARGYLVMRVGEGPFRTHFSSCPDADEHRRKAAA